MSVMKSFFVVCVGLFAASLVAQEPPKAAMLGKIVRHDPRFDALVAKAWVSPGCYGARIMGAGFGGSVLALVDRAQVKTFVTSIGRPALICATADGAYVTPQ